jgi:hypothetical protein
MTARSTIISAATMACMLAGCANDGSLSTGLNTGSVNPQTAAGTQSKSQEALCLTLASQIEALNTEGVPDKVSKAAAKKYKLKATDLTKADELNKANTEFQGKCSSYPPRVAAAVPAESKDTAAANETPKVATAKVKPPVPPQKPVAAAMATQETTQASSGPVAVGAPE